jgi:hypothetical protein
MTQMEIVFCPVPFDMIMRLFVSLFFVQSWGTTVGMRHPSGLFAQRFFADGAPSGQRN